MYTPRTPSVQTEKGPDEAGATKASEAGQRKRQATGQWIGGVKTKTAAPREEEGHRRFCSDPAREEERRSVMSRTRGQGGGGPPIRCSVRPREEEGQHRNLLGHLARREMRRPSGRRTRAAACPIGSGRRRSRSKPNFVATSRGREEGKPPDRQALGRRSGPFDKDGAGCPDLKGVGIREETMPTLLHGTPREEEGVRQKTYLP